MPASLCTPRFRILRWATKMSLFYRYVRTPQLIAWQATQFAGNFPSFPACVLNCDVYVCAGKCWSRLPQGHVWWDWYRKASLLPFFERRAGHCSRICCKSDNPKDAATALSDCTPSCKLRLCPELRITHLVKWRSGADSILENCWDGIVTRTRLLLS